MWFFIANILVFLHSCLVLADPITLPLHRYRPRELTANGTARLGIAPLTLSSDKQSYYTVINVGEIHFRVALDTASSDLWILSSECSTKECRSLPSYPRSYTSPTYGDIVNGTVPFSASYADGTAVSGFVAREAVGISNLTSPSQVFGMITQSNVSLVDKISGVLGLGFPRLSSVPKTVANGLPFFGTLAQQGLLEYPVFGLSLTNASTGSLSLGGVDSSVVTNASLISWNAVYDFPPFGSESNVSSYLHWAIPISAFSYNQTQFTPMPTYPNSTRNASLALLDIGASGIYGPYQDVARLFDLIDGARLVDSSGQWAIPCDTLAPMSFTLGNRNYTLQPLDYIIGPASGNPNLCLSWPKASPPSADGIDWQLGTPFLRRVYSIYSFGVNNKEPPLIGLYPLYNDTETAQTPAFVSSILSSASATIATTLPNFLLPTPTHTLAPYQFNTTVEHLSKGIATSGLATSTYLPLLGPQSVFNTTVLPKITPSPTATTFVITNSAGLIVTAVSTYSTPTVTLGVPPGWSAGSTLHTSFYTKIFPMLLSSWMLIYLVDLFIVLIIA